jgi:hypothetical protein
MMMFMVKFILAIHGMKQLTVSVAIIHKTCPWVLKIFGDKSHLDLKGALSTIPIIFTFTCFNQNARNKVENWRPLSFLPNLSHGVLSSKNKKSNKKNPVLSVQDEHNCLWVAFSSLVDIYLCGGIKATVMGRVVIVKP